MSVEFRNELVSLLPRLRRYAAALSGSIEEGDDLVQAACEQALAKSHLFTPGTRLDSWMYRIVQTRWIDHVRRGARRPSVDPADVDDLLAFDPRIHERLQASDELEIVRAEVARMPQEQRSVLALVAVEGLSYQEAAAALGIPIGTVMSRLSRARRRLAVAIDQPAKPVLPEGLPS